MFQIYLLLNYLFISKMWKIFIHGLINMLLIFNCYLKYFKLHIEHMLAPRKHTSQIITYSTGGVPRAFRLHSYTNSTCISIKKKPA